MRDSMDTPRTVEDDENEDTGLLSSGAAKENKRHRSNKKKKKKHETSSSKRLSSSSKRLSSGTNGTSLPSPLNQNIVESHVDGIRSFTAGTKPLTVLLDSLIYDDVLPPHLSHDALARVFDEVDSWAELLNNGKILPRLLAVQGDVDELLGIEPLYRDSMNYQPELTPWTPTVKLLRDVVSDAIGKPLNHAVICFYRNSEDYLSETSCPTLDLTEGTPIAKLSLGAPRTIILRDKRLKGGERRPSPRPTTKVELTHGSLFCLGHQSNRLMTHEIKRVSHGKNDDHTRICITFRHVATFQTENGEIFGKGSTASTLGEATPPPAAADKRLAAVEQLRGAFHRENRDSDFDRRRHYGGGSNVIPFRYVTSCFQDFPLVVGEAVAALDATIHAANGEHSNSQLSQIVRTQRTTPLAVGSSPTRAQASTPISLGTSPALGRGSTPISLGTSPVQGQGSTPLSLGASPAQGRGSTPLSLGSSSAQSRGLWLGTSTAQGPSHQGTPAYRLPSHANTSEEKKGDDDAEDTIPIIFPHNDYGKPPEPNVLEPIPSFDGTESGMSSTYTDSVASRSRRYQVADKQNHGLALSSKLPPEPAWPENTGIAMLALDLQNDFLGEDPSFFFGKLGSPIAPRRPALLNRVGELAKQVRLMGGVVFFVKSQYGAWSSPQSQQFGRLKQPGAHMEKVDCCSINSAGADFHPDVETMIVKQDVILIKEWYSAFMGTTLDCQLQRLKIGHVVVCGVTTNHSVAATARSAANFGYNVVLSSDGTAQLDETLQKQSEEKLASLSTLLHKGQSLAEVLPSNQRSISMGVQAPDKLALEIDSFTTRLSGFGAGDSIVVPDFLDGAIASDLYHSMLPGSSNEIDWGDLSREGESFGNTAIQFEPNAQGHMPVYRSGGSQPWDRNFRAGTFSDPVQAMKAMVEKQTGHSLNWSQILCYRDGTESSGWCADKNLDVRAGSFIAAVSLGGDRTLELKPKKDDSSLAPQRIRLQHNSLLLLGPETTRLFLHSIPPDQDSSTPHIQFTFLDIATFFTKTDSSLGVPALYGQGTEYGSHAELQEAVATRRVMEQTGMALAGLYTMSAVGPGHIAAGSMGFPIVCSVVATAATAMWFQQERKKAWQEQQRRLFELYDDCIEEPLTIEEARHRILDDKK